MSFKKIGSSVFFHPLIFLLSFLILYTRRPDAILNPQFWAEDGTVWYADAYNKGILMPLLTPRDGYFQTVSKLTADAAQFIPLLYAPLLFNLTALAVKILFVNFLISSRCENLIPNKALRFLVAAIYLSLPNSYEIHGNLTNAQWSLAMLACLVVLAAPSEKFLWKAFDVFIVALSALSGPFCLFLLPVAGIRWRIKRDSWILKLFCILSVGAIVQIAALTVVGSMRPAKTGLGATVGLFFEIIGGQIFFASLTSLTEYDLLVYTRHAWTPFWGFLITTIGCIPIFYALWKGTLELRLCLLFAVLITSGALLSPAITLEKPQWLELWLPLAGNRYWLIPMFGFIISVLFTLFKTSNIYLRALALLLCLNLLVAMYKDWVYRPYKDFNFSTEAKRFEEAPGGAEVKIPINPGWEMTLIKK